MGKRMIKLLIAAVLLLSFAGCSNQNTVKVQSNTTYIGTVSAISTSFITVSDETGDVTIELTDETEVVQEAGMFNQQPGAMGQMPSEMGQPFGEMSEEMNPEKPEGEMNGEGNLGAEPPEKPEGFDTENNRPDGTSLEMPQGGMNEGSGFESISGMGQSLTIADISLSDTVTVLTDDSGKAASITIASEGMNMEMPGGMASGVDSYDAAFEFTSDANETGMNYASSAKDENAVHVYEGANVSLMDSVVTRESEDSTGGDTSSFYGVGAAVLVTEGTFLVSDSTISTDAAGGAGVFAYGDGISYVMNTTIDTQKDTSGGIHVAGGGTLYAWDLLVETDGESSAAIRSDRGSGTMVVDGGTYVSNGVGSPAIYSAADITVHRADLISTGSEAICIEGLNSIRLFDCSLSGDMEDLSQNDCTWNVILYQSMSGDSEIGNSTFEMIGGSLTAGNGGMFYTTNTESTFILSDVDITYAQDSEFFLKCTGNANQRGWGTAGNNGADCSFTAIDQVMEGNVIWDSISQLDLYVLEGSTLTGALINDESNAGNGGNGYASLYLDDNSTWIVTGNSTLTHLYCEGTIVDEQGNNVTILNADGTVYVQGNSQYTITVDSYDESADVSLASSADSWDDFEVAKP